MCCIFKSILKCLPEILLTNQLLGVTVGQTQTGDRRCFMPAFRRQSTQEPFRFM